MEKQMAFVLLKLGLQHATPPVTDVVLEVGNRVLVWRQREGLRAALVSSWDHTYSVELTPNASFSTFKILTLDRHAPSM